MSKSSYIEFRGEGFWAHDVAQAVFLKHLVDRAEIYLQSRSGSWLQDAVRNWRIEAVISDLGLYLDEHWTDENCKTVQQLIQEACEELKKLETISGREAESWSIIDGRGIDVRGAPEIPIPPLVELGRAIQALLSGTLEKAPPGHWWFYGIEEGRVTLAKGK